MPRRRTLLIGAVATATAMLAACDNSQSAPAAKAAPLDKLALAGTAHGFTVGQAMAATTVYVFFDAQCPHCAALWASAQPLLTKIRMHWIPVGILRAASTSQGAFILSSKDPIAAMQEHEASMSKNQGGISVPLSGVDDEFRAKVAKNTEIFNQIGAESIPFLVFKSPSTGAIATQAGSMPTSALAKLLNVTP